MPLKRKPLIKQTHVGPRLAAPTADQDIAERLARGLPYVLPNSRGFAESLIANEPYGWSDKQRTWATTLLEQARDAYRRAHGKPASALTPQSGEQRLSNPALAGLMRLFDQAAASGLKRALLLARTSEGERLRLKRRDDGVVSVYAADVQGRDGWRGNVQADGAAGRMAAPVLLALEDLGRDPARAAKAFGDATAVCCFCARDLSDARSTKVGYGPICAERYSLPWG